MYLNKFAVGVIHALLKKCGLRRAGAHHRIRGSPENRPNSTGAENHRIGRERLHLHGVQIHRANSAADSAVVNHCRKKRPRFEFFNAAFRFMPSNLLIQRVQQLLTRRRPCKRCAVIKRSAESPVIQQSFRGAVKHHAHAIQQIDNPGRRFAHAAHQSLVRQKIAAKNRVVEMFGDGIPFAFLILRRVDSTLRAHRMRPLHRHNRKQIHRYARFRHANRSHEPGQTSTHNDNFWLAHLFIYEAKGCQSYRKLIKIRIPIRLKLSPTKTPNCPAARCARTVAARPHLHRKFQIPTPR